MRIDVSNLAGKMKEKEQNENDLFWILTDSEQTKQTNSPSLDTNKHQSSIPFDLKKWNFFTCFFIKSNGRNENFQKKNYFSRNFIKNFHYFLLLLKKNTAKIVVIVEIAQLFLPKSNVLKILFFKNFIFFFLRTFLSNVVFRKILNGFFRLLLS